MLVGYALLVAPLYNARYLTFCVPAVGVLLGIGLVKLVDVRIRGAALRRGLISALVASLIVLLSLPVYLSQRDVYAKSGADWKTISGFVAAHRAPDQAIYFAPRTPQTEEVGITSRIAQILYPEPFAGLRDLTLVKTPAEDASLWGLSRPLAQSTDRLAGIDSVIVIRRKDYPDAALAADDAVLTAAGFHAGDNWTGPLNTVAEYVR